MSLQVAFLLAAATTVGAPSTPPDAPPAGVSADPTATIKGADLGLVQAVRAVAERIASIVHVPARPDFIAVRADESVRFAEARVRAERLLPPVVAAARGRAWSDLGLGIASDPAELTMALELDLAGMTLDSSRSRLLVDATRMTEDTGKWGRNEDDEASLILATGVAADEPVAGHYIAHVLTDAAPPSAPVTTDALLARAALSEGTADVAALLLLFGGVGLEAEVVTGKLRPDDVLGGRLVGASVHATDAAVSSFSAFVYLDGFAQAASLVEHGDFRRLMLERKVRRTTSDVMHLDRPPAPAVELPPVALPASLALAPVDHDSLGEEGIVVLVSQLTGKDNLGLIAGDGWAADTVWRFEPAGGPTAGAPGVTVWVTAWRSEEEAKDFAYALERCLQSRFPGENAQDAGAGARVLARPDRVYRLERKGTEVRFQVADPVSDTRIVGSTQKKAAARPNHSQKK